MTLITAENHEKPNRASIGLVYPPHGSDSGLRPLPLVGRQNNKSFEVPFMPQPLDAPKWPTKTPDPQEQEVSEGWPKKARRDCSGTAVTLKLRLKLPSTVTPLSYELDLTRESGWGYHAISPTVYVTYRIATTSCYSRTSAPLTWILLCTCIEVRGSIIPCRDS